MKLLKKIGEGESWTSAVIGYKLIKYLNLDDSETTSLKVSIYIGVLLIKIEFIIV